MSKNVYQWQGTDVKVRFGTYKIEENKSSPLFWYNYEVLKLGLKEVPVIEITYQETKKSSKQVFYIANHYGYGVRKLEAGGWPNMGHMSVGYDSSKFTEFTPQQWNKEKFKYLNDDIIKYRQYEKDRDYWQKITYPKEHAKLQALINARPKGGKNG